MRSGASMGTFRSPARSEDEAPFPKKEPDPFVEILKLQKISDIVITSWSISGKCTPLRKKWLVSQPQGGGPEADTARKRSGSTIPPSSSFEKKNLGKYLNNH